MSGMSAALAALLLSVGLLCARARRDRGAGSARLQGLCCGSRSGAGGAGIAVGRRWRSMASRCRWRCPPGRALAAATRRGNAIVSGGVTLALVAAVGALFDRVGAGDVVASACR